MNEDDLRMLDEWRHARISDDDFARMQNRLFEDAQLRAELRAMAGIEEGLHALATPPEQTGLPARQDKKKTRPVWWVRVTAAAAIILVAVLAHHLLKPTIHVDPQNGWEIVASDDAQFHEISAGHLKLERGEIHVVSRNASPLKITTPNAQAVLTDSVEFYIGTHHPNKSTNPKSETENTMNMNLTRILVVAGSISLTTPNGTATADPGELAIAKGDSPPEVIAVSSNNNFGFDIYKQMAKGKEGENLFLSPYSILNALAILSEGARGTTAEEIGNVLHFPEEARRIGDESMIPWETAKMHVGIGNLNRRLNTAGKGEHYKLSLANALWADKSLNVSEEFERKIVDAYGTGAIRESDFSNSPNVERKKLNTWVEEQTNNKIADLFPDGSISGDTRMVIANAIYFQANWKVPFDPEMTHKNRKFRCADGSTTDVELMLHEDFAGVRYAAFKADGSVAGEHLELPADGFQILELPYKGEALSMVIVLPEKPDGLHDLEARIDATKLDEWYSKLEVPEPMTVMLPKFKFSAGGSIKEALIALGMESAFDKENANLGGLSDSPTPLWVSEAVHKSFIEVNELGTEAAAATGVGISADSISPWFIADRPFLFLIRDLQTGTTFFLGRVMKP